VSAEIEIKTAGWQKFICRSHQPFGGGSDLEAHVAVEDKRWNMPGSVVPSDS